MIEGVGLGWVGGGGLEGCAPRLALGHHCGILSMENMVAMVLSIGMPQALSSLRACLQSEQRELRSCSPLRVF